jgi:nucleoside 2-deoxyribosyltransferase
MSKDYVYLAGPMEDKTRDEMCAWRRKCHEYLNEMGILVLDPTRRISFHKQLDKNLQNEIRGMNVCQRIFKQDLQDIADSRVVIADVRRKSGRGTGTSMELMFAHMKNKIIILWTEDDDYPHPFIEAIATEKHYTLEDVLSAASSYY